MLLTVLSTIIKARTFKHGKKVDTLTRNTVVN